MTTSEKKKDSVELKTFAKEGLEASSKNPGSKKPKNPPPE